MFILNSRAEKCVNPVLKVHVTKEGERDARQLQISGSLLRKRCCRGGLHTFGLGRVMVRGIWRLAFCLCSPSPWIPSPDCTCESFSCASAQTSCSGNAVGRELGHRNLWAIFYAHEKNNVSDSPRGTPFSTNQFRTVVTK